MISQEVAVDVASGRLQLAKCFGPLCKQANGLRRLQAVPDSVGLRLSFCLEKRATSRLAVNQEQGLFTIIDRLVTHDRVLQLGNFASAVCRLTWTL